MSCRGEDAVAVQTESCQVEAPKKLAQLGHDVDYVIVASLLEMCRRLGYHSII